MPKFIFANILGCFIFSENHKLQKEYLFKSLEDLENKATLKSELEKKYPELVKPEGEDLKKILIHFKDKKYFKQFEVRNKEITKTAVKSSVSKDNLIIQTIDTIDEIDRTLNLLTKRLREWYALYLPEIENKIQNHEQFVSLISEKNKEQILKELHISEQESMGASFSKNDLSAVSLLIAQVNNFYKIRKKYEEYLGVIEKDICPNLYEIGGATITAKLIAHAGSLKRLAEMPASTLQVLGAEKALFRHIKNKKRNLPPKYGLLHEHQLIQKSHHKDHGKVARALADKLSFAARIDYYKGEFVGDKYKKELIKKFNITY